MNQYQLKGVMPSWICLTPPKANYVIVDCAHFDKDFYHQMMYEESATSRSLFDGTIHIKAVEAAPLLMTLRPIFEHSLIKRMINIQRKYPAVVWLTSELGFEDLFMQLQSLLFVKLPDDREVLCRYYDPRCLLIYLTGLSQNDVFRQKLNLIEQWAVWDNTKEQYDYFSTPNYKDGASFV